jgi:uncharacterized protein (DUF433 family)
MKVEGITKQQAEAIIKNFPDVTLEDIRDAQ